tara:strand:- start:380 stop:541 length:162 start_codon:yes stop_codon:yes gene_type:complete
MFMSMFQVGGFISINEFSLTLQIDKFFKSLLRWASRSVGILPGMAENCGFPVL